MYERLWWAEVAIIYPPESCLQWLALPCFKKGRHPHITIKSESLMGQVQLFDVPAVESSAWFNDRRCVRTAREQT